ncbi:hypothetical protein ACFO5Q_02310 [Kordiimonas lipolytica]|uniref:Uncharacterized protein n=1 Tax=Kordiimonas lipolytica TaxID=1662421 RepID=A0ABV8U871_9PROT|nr:hypothetical protein [Kordiimonas lipolytica]
MDTQDDIDEIFDDLPSLKSVAPFVALASNVRWFRTLGEDPDRQTVEIARAYAEALGFPEAEPGFLADWEEAADAAENTEVNSPAWEAEEQLRAALTDDALGVLDEQTLEMVMTHVTGAVSETIEESATEASRDLRILDEEFVRATSGAAVQATYQAALAAMTGAEEDHPFALRFQLFEKGRWPIGIIGNSFLIF